MKVSMALINTCYKKFKMATSIAQKRGIEFGMEADNGEVGPSPKQRSRRSGEGKTTLFPDYCMFCKKKDHITVHYKKQWPHKLECEEADKKIIQAANNKNDAVMQKYVQGQKWFELEFNILTSVIEITLGLYMKPLVMKASHI